MVDEIAVGIGIFVVLYSTVFIGLAALRWFSERVRRWCCRELGWHLGLTSITGFDRCSIHGRCVICDKDVMMDSHGNWF